MPTVLRVDPERPDPEIIHRAAAVIQEGGLVGMPTETVYGLAGDALNPTAIARIYAAKGRPSHNPLIAHVADRGEARRHAADWPEVAEALAVRFWPGPLTLVVPRVRHIPQELTAGLDTVGLRMPRHPVALALIRAVGRPLAAPSANRFTEVSPVTAEQVARGLGAGVSLILDAGRTQVGIESTVVAVTGEGVTLLRPGMIQRSMLGEVVGPLQSPGALPTDEAPRPAPGMTPRHYAPRARIRLVPSARWDQMLEGPPEGGRGGLPAANASAGAGTGGGASTGAGAGRGGGVRVGAITWSLPVPEGAAFGRRLPASAEAYAADLYDAFHAADAAGCRELLVEEVPEGPEWDAVRDRLRRAAHPANPSPLYSSDSGGSGQP